MNDAGRVIILPKGEYVAATTYYPLDAVIYNGNTYVAIKETTGNLPTDEIYWKIFVKGATLMQGATADADGAAGYIPKPLIADKDKFFKGDGTWAEVDMESKLDKTTSTSNAGKTVMVGDNGDLVFNQVAQVSNPNLLDNGWFNVNSRGQSEYTSNNKYTADRWKINHFVSGQGSVSVSDNGLTISSASDVATNRIQQRLKLLKKGKYTLSVNITNNSGNCKLGCYYNTSSAKLIGEFKADAIGILNVTFEVLDDMENVDIFMQKGKICDFTIKAVKLEIGSVSTLHLDTAPDVELEKLRCVTSTADPSDTFANKTLQQPVSDEWDASKTYNVGDYFIEGNQLWKTKVQHSGVIPTEGEYVEKTSVTEELKKSACRNVASTIEANNNITVNMINVKIVNGLAIIYGRFTTTANLNQYEKLIDGLPYNPNNNVFANNEVFIGSSSTRLVTNKKLNTGETIDFYVMYYTTD